MSLCDIIIHVNNDLDAVARDTLEQSLRAVDGVIAPRFNADKTHLLVISYNAAQTTSATLLATVQAQGYKAQLVGL
jgi:hypothetical protein